MDYKALITKQNLQWLHFFAIATCIGDFGPKTGFHNRACEGKDN